MKEYYLVPNKNVNTGKREVGGGKEREKTSKEIILKEDKNNQGEVLGDTLR